MKPLISVIVPIYDAEEFLNECVDSIINQTYENLEIILVNDGSPDNCAKICEEYASTYNHIRVIHKENGGLVSARKTGIVASKGEYIGFVDADDWINENMYAYLMDIIQREDVEFAQIAPIHEFESRSDNRKYGITGILGRYEKDDRCSYKHMYGTDKNNITQISIPPWNKLCRKNIYEKFYLNIPDDLSIYEDALFSHGCMPFVNRFYLDNANLYHYRQHKDSMVHKNLPHYRYKDGENSIVDSSVYESSIFKLNKVYEYFIELFKEHSESNILIEELKKFYAYRISQIIFSALPMEIKEDVLEYRFPLETLVSSKKIVVCGNYDIVSRYCQSLPNDNIEVVAILDINDSYKDINLLNNYKNLDSYDVIYTSNLPTLEFDNILILSQDNSVNDSIKDELINKFHVKKDKIICNCLETNRMLLFS